MTTETEQVIETTSSPSPVETPAASTPTTPAPAQAAEAAPTTPGTPAAPVIPQWTLNPKFEVRRKEHEIPEFLRGAITNPEHEKSVKDILQKALGLDFAKEAIAKFEGENKGYAEKLSKYEPVMSRVNEITGFIKEGNAGNPEALERAFRDMGVSDDALLKYYQYRVQLNQMDPRAREAIEKRSTVERENEELRQKLQHFESTSEETQRNASLERIDRELASPAYQAAIQAFEKNNEGQSFRDFVIVTGGMLERRAKASGGAMPTINDAVNAAVRMIGGAAPQGPSTPTPPKINEKPPVIPNVPSGEATPVAPAFTSIEDVIRHRDQQHGAI
jgi:hypothetical protein